MRKPIFEYPDNIESCPKCGRKPVIHVIGVNYARIECKPMLRKAHLSVYTGYKHPSELMGEARKIWNEAVDCANLTVKMDLEARDGQDV